MNKKGLKRKIKAQVIFRYIRSRFKTFHAKTSRSKTNINGSTFKKGDIQDK